jgi:hypothetical protein
MHTPIVNNEYKYYIVLVEGSTEYQAYREKGIEILLRALPEILEPGDKIAAIWMEVLNLGNDNALFFTGEVESFATPVLLSEPVPVITPLPTPLRGGETVASRQQHNNAIKEVEQQNEQIRQSNNCRYVYPTRESNNLAIEKWKHQNEEEKERVVDLFSQSINTIDPDYMSVFEALKLTSDIFGEVCGNGIYNDCQLIIISNMIDWRYDLKNPKDMNAIQNMHIDFSEISVSVIWPDCDFFTDEFKSQCGSRKEIWERHFQTFNASDDNGNLMFINSDNATERLKDFIGE